VACVAFISSRCSAQTLAFLSIFIFHRAGVNTKLYGLDQDGGAPFGSVFHLYLNCSKEAAESSTGDGGAESVEDRKNMMLKILDGEIQRLENRLKQFIAFTIDRHQYQKLADLARLQRFQNVCCDTKRI
jgi:hypothetical protein